MSQSGAKPFVCVRAAQSDNKLKTSPQLEMWAPSGAQRYTAECTSSSASGRRITRGAKPLFQVTVCNVLCATCCVQRALYSMRSLRGNSFPSGPCPSHQGTVPVSASTAAMGKDSSRVRLRLSGHKKARNEESSPKIHRIRCTTSLVPPCL